MLVAFKLNLLILATVLFAVGLSVHRPVENVGDFVRFKTEYRWALIQRQVLDPIVF